MIKKIIKLYNFKNYIIFKINMKSFRNQKYLERYEDVVFDLEQPLDINPNDGQYQKREVMKIVADNTGETILHLIGIIQDYLLILKLIN